MALLIMGTFVNGATPSCGGTITTGQNIVFDSDLVCDTYTNVDGRDITIDCAGYSIDTVGTAFDIYPSDGNGQNITIKNCNVINKSSFLWLTNNLTGLTIINNNMDIDGGHFAEIYLDISLIMDDVNISNNTFRSSSGLTGCLLCWANEMTSCDSFNFYNNDVQYYNNIFDSEVGSYCSGSNILDVSANTGIGNYYNVTNPNSPYSCVDGDSDGFCDTPFSETETPSALTVIDSYTLSIYPYIPVPVCEEEWSSCDDIFFTQTRCDEERACSVSNFVYGNSTDFTQVDDPENVINAVIETETGSIAWNTNINVSGSDLTTNIIFTDTILFVNTNELHESLNVPTNITFTVPEGEGKDDYCDKGFVLFYTENYYGTVRDMFNEYLRNTGGVRRMADKTNLGGDCNDPSICKNVECTGNVVTFEAQHFSGFFFGEPYTESDLAPLILDVIIKSLIVLGIFIPIILIILGGLWFKKNIIK